MNTITIELCAEDRARLDAIIEGLKANKPNCKGCVENAIRMVAPAETIANPIIEDPVPEAPAAEAPAPAPEVKPVSLAEFQKAVTQVCAKGPEQKQAAKEIINKYACSVSAVPEDKRAEAMAELEKI